MNQHEHDELVNILAEAQAMVEEAFGGLSSSTLKDHIVVHLCGALVGEWFERRPQATRKLPLGPPPIEEFLEEAAASVGRQRSKQQTRAQTALLLTGEMMDHCPGKARDRAWVWDTFIYFLRRAGEKEEPG